MKFKRGFQLTYVANAVLDDEKFDDARLGKLMRKLWRAQVARMRQLDGFKRMGHMHLELRTVADCEVEE